MRGRSPPPRPALLLVALAMAAPAQSAERVLRFGPPDREALRAWDELLRHDAALAADARRNRFRPPRDLAALRTDLDGDGRPELILHANLMPYCGSAGCLMRILVRREGGWAVACETAAEQEVGPVLGSTRSAGWLDFRATYRITWREAPSRPAEIACVEGEAVERSRQGRI